MKIRLYLLKIDGSYLELTTCNIEKINELDFIGLLLSSENKLVEKNNYLFIGDFGCEIQYIASIDNSFW